MMKIWTHSFLILILLNSSIVYANPNAINRAKGIEKTFKSLAPNTRLYDHLAKSATADELSWLKSVAGTLKVKDGPAVKREGTIFYLIEEGGQTTTIETAKLPNILLVNNQKLDVTGKTTKQLYTAIENLLGKRMSLWELMIPRAHAVGGNIVALIIIILLFAGIGGWALGSTEVAAMKDAHLACEKFQNSDVFNRGPQTDKEMADLKSAYRNLLWANGKFDLKKTESFKQKEMQALKDCVGTILPKIEKVLPTDFVEATKADLNDRVGGAYDENKTPSTDAGQ